MMIFNIYVQYRSITKGYQGVRIKQLSNNLRIQLQHPSRAQFRRGGKVVPTQAEGFRGEDRLLLTSTDMGPVEAWWSMFLLHHFFQKRRVILHYFSRIRLFSVFGHCYSVLTLQIIQNFQDWHRKARMRAEDVVNSWEIWPQQVLAMSNCPSQPLDHMLLGKPL